MNRPYSFRVVMMTAALALAASPCLLAQTHRHSRHARSAAAKAAASGQMAGQGFGVPETLSGTIQMVVADQDLVVVNGPNQVPFDMKVTPKTLVVVNEKRGTIESLADQVGKPVSVAFVPQRDGDIATRVEVTD